MSDEKKCEVPGCNFEAEYNSPGDWCKRHWNKWWNWSENKSEPRWMTNPFSRDRDK